MKSYRPSLIIRGAHMGAISSWLNMSDAPYAPIPCIFCCYIQFSKYCLHSNPSDVIHNYVGSVQMLFEDPNYPPPVNVTTFIPFTSSWWNKLLCTKVLSHSRAHRAFHYLFVTELFLWLVTGHVWPSGLQLDQAILTPTRHWRDNLAR